MNDVTLPVTAIVGIALAQVGGVAALVKWIVGREFGHLDTRLKAIEQQGSGAVKEIHELKLDVAKNYFTKGEVQGFMTRVSKAIQDIPCKRGSACDLREES